jgi:hypothetical protein
MIMDTEFSGTIFQIAAISTNRSDVAVSVPTGAWHVLSSTALDAGVFAVYLNRLNNSPLQIGASPAKVYLFSWISENIVFSPASCDVLSNIAPPSASTWIVVALHVRFFPVT